MFVCTSVSLFIGFIVFTINILYYLVKNERLIDEVSGSRVNTVKHPSFSSLRESPEKLPGVTDGNRNA